MPKLLTEDLIVGDIIHEWSLNEYERHDRGLKWYLFIFGSASLLVLIAIWTDNFLFALIIILVAIIMFLQHHQEAEQVLFQITDLGVIIGYRFYPYGELGDFYIIYQPPVVKTLFIGTKSPVRPTLRIPLYDQNPVEVRHTLLEFIGEDLDKEEEPFSESVVRYFKLH